MIAPAHAPGSRLRYLAQAAVLLLAASIVPSAAAEARHALAMHGEPAYGPGFTHFPYANPDAPRGGRFTQGIVGSFDNLNPFAIRGTPFTQVRGYVIEGLMVRGLDEPFSVYALIARSIETDEARSYVSFSLDPRAKFSDGRPVTPEDVLFSWRILRDKGRPNHRLYYSKVVRAEKVGANGVRFEFADGGDRELPLILALMPVLPKHATDAEHFDEPSLKAPVGSGPYVVEEVRAGGFVQFKRNPNYWAADLPPNRGLYNFDELRFEFYRDATSWFEAFKRQLYDVRFEEDPGRWATEYDFPAARADGLIREEIGSGAPKPMFALVFNTRRPLFADVRVREALIELFDFEWMNGKLFFSAYRRTGSFFEGSDLAALGVAATDAEKALLQPFANDLLPAVLDGSYRPPVSDGTGHDRGRLKHALASLAAAGWELREGKLVHRKDGAPFRFEILVATRDDERLATVYSTLLKRAGIVADVRFVDGVQYEARRQNYDFDMLPFTWGNSLSPGNELFFYFGSESAGRAGTRNYMGMKNAAADAMIQQILRARSPDELRTAARALDRVLMSGRYVIPLYHLPKQRLARWPYIVRPQYTALYGPQPDTWWHREARP